MSIYETIFDAGSVMLGMAVQASDSALRGMIHPCSADRAQTTDFQQKAIPDGQKKMHEVAHDFFTEYFAC